MYEVIDIFQRIIKTVILITFFSHKNHLIRTVLNEKPKDLNYINRIFDVIDKVWICPSALGTW